MCANDNDTMSNTFFCKKKEKFTILWIADYCVVAYSNICHFIFVLFCRSYDRKLLFFFVSNLVYIKFFLTSGVNE